MTSESSAGVLVGNLQFVSSPSRPLGMGWKCSTFVADSKVTVAAFRKQKVGGSTGVLWLPFLGPDLKIYAWRRVCYALKGSVLRSLEVGCSAWCRYYFLFCSEFG